jgi:hypothetical protein
VPIHDYAVVSDWLDRNWDTIVNEANRRGMAGEEFVVHMLADVIDVYGNESDAEAEYRETQQAEYDQAWPDINMGSYGS